MRGDAVAANYIKRHGGLHSRAGRPTDTDALFATERHSFLSNTATFLPIIDDPIYITTIPHMHWVQPRPEAILHEQGGNSVFIELTFLARPILLTYCPKSVGQFNDIPRASR